MTPITLTYPWRTAELKLEETQKLKNLYNNLSWLNQDKCIVKAYIKKILIATSSFSNDDFTFIQLLTELINLASKEFSKGKINYNKLYPIKIDIYENEKREKPKTQYIYYITHALYIALLKELEEWGY